MKGVDKRLLRWMLGFFCTWRGGAFCVALTLNSKPPRRCASNLMALGLFSLQLARFLLRLLLPKNMSSFASAGRRMSLCFMSLCPKLAAFGVCLLQLAFGQWSSTKDMVKDGPSVGTGTRHHNKSDSMEKVNPPLHFWVAGDALRSHSLKIF